MQVWSFPLLGPQEAVQSSAEGPGSVWAAAQVSWHWGCHPMTSDFCSLCGIYQQKRRSGEIGPSLSPESAAPAHI